MPMNPAQRRAMFAQQNPEEKRQRRKAFWLRAGGTAVGSAAGLAAGYGALKFKPVRRLMRNQPINTQASLYDLASGVGGAVGAGAGWVGGYMLGRRKNRKIK